MRWLPAVMLVATAVLVGQAQTYRARTDAVTVDVLALDGNRPIAGLAAKDFALFDNDVRQQIHEVAIQEVPFNMLLVLDTSSSVEGGLLRDLQSAARGAVGSLRADDRGSVMTFAQALEGTPDWTSDQAMLTTVIDRSKASGMTSLHDAAFAALMRVDPEPGRRRLILVFTDGDDTASWLPSAAVLEAGARSDAVVYAVTMSRTAPREPLTLKRRSGIRLKPNATLVDSTPFLSELTRRTGGDFIIESAASGLRRTFERIVAEFRTRYVLTYTPRNVAPAGWHAIKVELVGRKGTIKARPGYDR